MLLLSPIRSLHRSRRPFLTRTLRTRPPRPPAFVNTWKPSEYKQGSWPKPLSETEYPENVEDSSRKSDREALRETQGFTIPSSPSLTDLYSVWRLNRCLSGWATEQRVNKVRRSVLFKAYVHARDSNPSLLHLLPARAWDILWSSEYTSTPRSLQRVKGRREHLKRLYQDMKVAGRSTTVLQRVVYLKSLFKSHKEDQALQEWEDDRTQVGDNVRHDYKAEHLDCGVRMHALAGNLDRAREIMDELFHLYPAWDAKLMLSVLRAYARSPKPEHANIPSQIYVAFKKIMGEKIKLENYDACLVGFVEAQQLQSANQVLTDMVKDGLLATEYSDDQVNAVLRRLNMIFQLGTDVVKLTTIALHAISILPKAYHSHLFGEWMKRGIAQNAPEAMAQVLDLMFKRGYEPETFDFNMLLKTLFKSTQLQHKLKAENIGWQMIDKFREYPTSRSRSSSAKDVLTRNQNLQADSLGSITQKDVPAANATTFALLMQHHTNQTQWEHVDYLTRRMKDAKLPPNWEVMNVLMEKACRQSKYDEVWRIYRLLTRGSKEIPGIFPSGSTFRHLWKSLRLALGDHASREAMEGKLPSPRALLAEQVKWWEKVRSRHDAERYRIGLAGPDHGALNGLVMHCFSYTKDLPGSLVAMHVLRKRFDILPSDKSARIIQQQVAWVDLQRDSKNVRQAYSHSGVHAQKVANMSIIYQFLTDARFQRMNLTGDQYAYMSKEEIGDLNLHILSEFIRVILKRKYSPHQVEAMIDEAKGAIGVPDLRTGDRDAFDVA